MEFSTLLICVVERFEVPAKAKMMLLNEAAVSEERPRENR
jgi:hypothetical protein